LIYRNAQFAARGLLGRSKGMEDAMETEMRTYPRVDALIGMFADWLKHRREIAETCNCDARDLERIAQDLGVSGAELDDLIKRGPHAADELPRLMTALQLDPEAVARTQAMVMHDMERVCAHCTHKRRCEEDLGDGLSPQNYDDYCGNALTLQSLGAKKA
jgi:hypothetical protein